MEEHTGKFQDAITALEKQIAVEGEQLRALEAARVKKVKADNVGSGAKKVTMVKEDMELLSKFE